jgi:glycosyltransferase involved in cell wall biosynthesis
MFGHDNIYGGAERYALELARAMADQLRTRLVAFSARAWRGQMGNLKIHVYRNWIHFKRFRFDPINPQIVSDLAWADVIHYHQPHTMMASLALIYAMASKKPIFSTHLGGSGYGLHRLFDLTNWYDAHLHISDYSRSVFGHEHLPAADVIWGGVDTDRFCPHPGISRTQEVLYAGRLLPHKGINYLVEAVGPSMPLVLAGRRWSHASKFYGLLKTLAQGKSVSFVEDCTDDALINYYRRAMCIVLPSVYTTVFGEQYTIPELLGQTLLEGMACGTLGICTDVGAMPQIIEDGVNGFIVPPNDPATLKARLQWLAERPAEVERMGVNARNTVLQRFSWPRVVSRCRDAYRAVFAR